MHEWFFCTNLEEYGFLPKSRGDGLDEGVISDQQAEPDVDADTDADAPFYAKKSLQQPAAEEGSSDNNKKEIDNDVIDLIDDKLESDSNDVKTDAEKSQVSLTIWISRPDLNTEYFLILTAE